MDRGPAVAAKAGSWLERLRRPVAAFGRSRGGGAMLIGGSLALTAMVGAGGLCVARSAGGRGRRRAARRRPLHARKPRGQRGRDQGSDSGFHAGPAGRYHDSQRRRRHRPRLLDEPDHHQTGGRRHLRIQEPLVGRRRRRPGIPEGNASHSAIRRQPVRVRPCPGCIGVDGEEPFRMDRDPTGGAERRDTADRANRG